MATESVRYTVTHPAWKEAIAAATRPPSMATLACREAFAAATRPHSMATLAGKEAIAAATRPHSMATLAWREAIAAATRTLQLNQVESQVSELQIQQIELTKAIATLSRITANLANRQQRFEPVY